MKTIHQFGDSYGVQLYTKNKEYRIKNFVELCCNKLNYNYINKAKGGISNEMILNILITSIKKFKNGDIIFINFSFFSRGCWYDDTYKKIKSTNVLYNEMYNIKQFQLSKNEQVLNLVEYYLNNTKDYNMRIFTLINSILLYIKSIGVDIFYIFADDYDWVDDLLTIGTNIKFPNGLSRWLQRNNLHLEEEGHYTTGIQPILANTILNKTNNFTNCKTIHIDINDIDFNSPITITLKNKIL